MSVLLVMMRVILSLVVLIMQFEKRDAHDKMLDELEKKKRHVEMFGMFFL